MTVSSISCTTVEATFLEVSISAEGRPRVSVDLSSEHICRVVSSPTPQSQSASYHVLVYYDRSIVGEIQGAGVSATFALCGGYFGDLGDISRLTCSGFLHHLSVK